MRIEPKALDADRFPNGWVYVTCLVQECRHGADHATARENATVAVGQFHHRREARVKD